MAPAALLLLISFLAVIDGFSPPPLEEKHLLPVRLSIRPSLSIRPGTIWAPGSHIIEGEVSSKFYKIPLWKEAKKKRNSATTGRLSPKKKPHRLYKKLKVPKGKAKKLWSSTKEAGLKRAKGLKKAAKKVKPIRRTSSL